ncbi:asparaginyl-tRNA synthetase-like [Watersipora subatra]|uniref:asparaginyl-tRNA synthetase-like n=1 Tax=Watersipora subatra TaxID=2589382 RepID=UPI00355B39CC
MVWFAFCYAVPGRAPFYPLINGIFKRNIIVYNAVLSQFCTVSAENTPTLSINKASSSSFRGPCIINGWIKSVKHQSKHSFLHLEDGLSSRHLQVVVPACSRGNTSLYKFGAAVRVVGNLTDSPASGQSLEIQATEISLLGANDNENYPFSKKRYSADYARQHMHLRSKIPEFAAMLRLRNACRRAICNYFYRHDFVQIETPILTSNDCEGAGETFSLAMNKSGNPPYFGNTSDVKLTVSGQLHLETANSGISKVFTFGPTFRADHSVDRTHLAEFYMIEGEMSFVEQLEELLEFVEDFTKSIIATILENEQEDMAALLRASTSFEPTDLPRYLEKPFQRVTYTDAIKLLQSANQQFNAQPDFGNDLHKEHELYLLQAHDYLPVFVTNWPRSLKPFYMYTNDDGTAACMDLIVPGPGELVGGSLREHRYDELNKILSEKHMLEEYRWYLDIRKFGSAPHAGFGMGFERLLQFLFGVRQIRDTLPFPRYQNNCRL